MRAAGMLLMSTVAEPLTTESGGPTHRHTLPTVAEIIPAIIVVAPPGARIGPPTCGTGGVPGVTMGQVCISPTRAAGILMRGRLRLWAVPPPEGRGPP